MHIVTEKSLEIHKNLKKGWFQTHCPYPWHFFFPTHTLTLTNHNILNSYLSISNQVLISTQQFTGLRTLRFVRLACIVSISVSGT